MNACVEQVLGSNANAHVIDVSGDTQVGQWAALRSMDVDGCGCEETTTAEYVPSGDRECALQ